ncbi:thioredoxin family protein [Fibrobacterota bacterium]
MTAVPSTMLELGTRAPGFQLPDTAHDSREVSLETAARGAKATLAVFLANHCPYVKHIISELVTTIKDYQSRGLAAVAISSTDIQNYPDDSPEKMTELARELKFTFPYLYDEGQEVAKAYRAACTPDLYLFDAELKLVYRGQFDDSRPGNTIPVTGKDLRAAIEAVLEGREVPQEQIPSIGCNIKWKKGNEPEYF